MTTWNPGDGGPDVLSSGAPGPPWADRFRTTAVAVVCLLAGAFLGARLDEAGSPFAAQAAVPPVPLTAGVVSSAVGSPPEPHRFEVSLFNPGDQQVRARVLGLTGWTTAVTANPPVVVPAHGWAQAAFTLPEVCGEPMVPPVSAVRLRVDGPAGGSEQRVELAGPAAVLGDDHDLECRPPTSLSGDQLTGLWHLEEARGQWADLAGVALMRFTSDGRFAFDPEGQMFEEGQQGFFGPYRLHGSRLRLRADGGYACEEGYTEVWTTTLLDADRLRLDIVRSDPGYCHSPEGERQILRRLVPENRLPAG